MNQRDLWRVYGRIAGVKLPAEVIQLGRTRIGPLPNGVQVLEAPTLGIGTPSSGVGYGTVPAHIGVTSDCYFWIECEATSGDEALETVRANDAAILHANLSLTTTRLPYYFEILWAQSCIGVGHAPSRVVNAGYWEKENLDLSLIAVLQSQHKFFMSDDTGSLAAIKLSDAIQQAIKSRTPVDQDSALLSYFKVVEILATAIDITLPDDHEVEQERILLSLMKVLKSGKCVKKRVSAVLTAERHFSRQALRYLSLRIDAAAKALGLNDQWRDAANEFSKLRNTKLGHSGTTTSADQRQKWLHGVDGEYNALRLCREMLLAYMRAKISIGMGTR